MDLHLVHNGPQRLHGGDNCILVVGGGGQHVVAFCLSVGQQGVQGLHLFIGLIQQAGKLFNESGLCGRLLYTSRCV